VTGPDEYSALVNDNYYTNSMAKYHFDHINAFKHNCKKRPIIGVKQTIENNLVQMDSMDSMN